MDRINIFGMTVGELAEVLSPIGVPKFRAEQIARWLYQRGAQSFSEMTDLSKELRQKLSELFAIGRPTILTQLISADGATSKLLLEFADKATAETVLMRHSYGNSVCVSTQVGCNMACVFCASTLNGLTRNLTVGEIAAQVLVIEEILHAQGEKVDTIVIMGSGEPLENYDNVLGAVKLLHEKYNLGLSYRSFTLSTSGIVPNIYRLAEEGIPLSLSISLHAPTDEQRSRIMPINRRYPLRDVLEAAKNYAAVTGRRITYEYILIAELNDTAKDAEKLAELLRGSLASVNLIPINPVTERDFQRPGKNSIRRFKQKLEKLKIATTVRQEMGTDINAACGQLRNRRLKANHAEGSTIYQKGDHRDRQTGRNLRTQAESSVRS